MKKLLMIVMMCLLTSLPAQSKKILETEKVTNFNYSGSLIRPWSVYRNPMNNLYYISSLNGHPNADNATAHISVLSFKDLAKLEFVRYKNPIIISTEFPKTKLHAPKGMLAWGEWLVICDLDSLAIFKAEEGKKPVQVARIKIKGAKNLNSIEKVDGVIYLTDSESGGIFKITNFEDSEERKIEPLLKIPGASGMIYDEQKSALLIVSNKVNLIYELNLANEKENKTYTIGPKMTKAESDSQTGFVDIAMGNQRELYLAHYDLGRIMVYFRDEDRPLTIKKPMKYAKNFIEDLRTPSSLIYDSTFNRIGFIQFQFNSLSFKEGIPAQVTSNELKKEIKVEEKKTENKTEKKVEEKTGVKAK